MKRISICILILGLSLTFNPLFATVSVDSSSNSLVISKAEEKAHADAMILRLHAIKEMDKSNLSSSEKKMLRKEVRSMKKELAQSNGGIYLSVGAVIIIILLLIILL